MNMLNFISENQNDKQNIEIPNNSPNFVTNTPTAKKRVASKILII